MSWPAWFTPERRRVLRRAFKVALAATLATGVAKLFGLSNPWFATLAAVVAMQITLHASLQTARNSVIGAAIGAAAGLGMAVVAKDQLWAVGVVIFVSFAVFGVLKLEQVGRQAAIVASVIVLVPASVKLSTPEFAWVRFAETVIGIAVALAVNAFVLPPRGTRGARRNLGEAYTQLAEMYREVIAAEATGHRDVDRIIAARRAFRTHLRQVDDLWDEALSERPPLEVLAPHWRATTRRIWEQCTAMDDSVMDAAARNQLAGARTELRALADATAAALDDVSAALGDGRPIPTFPELDQRRAALLATVKSLDVHAGGLEFSEALQAFTFVNSMSVIATRLADLAVVGSTA